MSYLKNREMTVTANRHTTVCLSKVFRSASTKKTEDQNAFTNNEFAARLRTEASKLSILQCQILLPMTFFFCFQLSKKSFEDLGFNIRQRLPRHMKKRLQLIPKYTTLHRLRGSLVTSGKWNNDPCYSMYARKIGTFFFFLFSNWENSFWCISIQWIHVFIGGTINQ